MLIIKNRAKFDEGRMRYKTQFITYNSFHQKYVTFFPNISISIPV